MKEITQLVPNNQVLEYPETGDKIFFKDKEYTATCGGLLGATPDDYLEEIEENPA